MAALFLAFAYFFVLLSSFAVLRPVRDAMAIASGLENLPWLFTGTFAAMLVVVPLYGLLTQRFPRRVFIPVVYRLFALQVLAFWALLETGAAPVAAAAAFFVWVSVYNVFVVSVFWSFLADVFRTEQAKRLYGFIAAGGTLGMIVGPFATIGIASALGVAPLLLVTAALLEVAVQCAKALDRWARRRHAAERNEGEGEPVAGGVLAGFALVVRSPVLFGIAVHVFLYSLTSTFLYAEQQQLVRAAAEGAAAHTVILARIDLLTQLLALVIQTAVTGRILRRLGLGVALGTLPVVTGLGAGALAGAATLPVLILVQAVRRATQYAVERPGRESLFTAAGREVKYRTKSFMDTVVFRGGDWLSIWAHTGLAALGLGLVGFAGILAPLAVAWTGLTTWLGGAQTRLRRGRHGKLEPDAS